MDQPPVDYRTITTGYWQPQIGTPGQVVLDAQDIDQCIRTIMTTPKGADPLRPLFGFDGWQYIDWPINQARPHLVREITAALAWEPRIVIERVEITVVDEAPYHKLFALVSWRWAVDINERAVFQSMVNLGRGAA